MIGALIAIASVLAVLAVLAGIVGFIVSVIRNKEKGNRFDMRSLLKMYLYFTSFITLIIALFGGILFIKALLSYPFGFQFSYQVNEYYEPTKPGANDPYYQPYPSYEDNREVVTIDGTRYYAMTAERTRDLVNGATLFISLFILFLIHRVSTRFVEPKGDEVAGVKKGYIFTSLILYSLLAVIAIPTAIYQLINYLVFDMDRLTDYSRAIPGEALAAAVLLTPVWLIFLARVIMLNRMQNKAEKASAPAVIAE